METFFATSPFWDFFNKNFPGIRGKVRRGRDKRLFSNVALLLRVHVQQQVYVCLFCWQHFPAPIATAVDRYGAE